MSSNSTLARAFACLSHPLSLGAMAVLLLNDHLFRIYWPGWWTGKLGDFAWLFFFPFALLALLSLIIPVGLKQREPLAAVLAFALTGGVFALANTWAPFHAWIVDLSSNILGWKVGWVLDPSDLIALLSLPAAVWLWKRQVSESIRHPKFAWLLVVCAGFLTIANTPPSSELGINCLKIIDERVFAFSSEAVFWSEPGGLEWREVEPETVGRRWDHDCPNIYDYKSGIENRVWQDPQSNHVHYRIIPDKSIERSMDEGQSWQIELHLEPEPEVMQNYYRMRHDWRAEVYSTPFDAVFEPHTGSFILAMGHRGVLIRQADGSYSFAGVGIHRSEKYSLFKAFAILLPGEGLQAAILGGLIVLILWLRGRRFSIRHVIVGFVGLGLLYNMLFYPPALQGYDDIEWLFSVMQRALGIILLPLTIEVLTHANGQEDRYLLILGVTVVLFLLPFLAWGVNMIPNYRLAQFFAVAFVAGWVYWQYIDIRTHPL
jgi:hypothetical protein